MERMEKYDLHIYKRRFFGITMKMMHACWRTVIGIDFMYRIIDVLMVFLKRKQHSCT